MRKPKQSTQQRAKAIKLKLAKLQQDYVTQLYFETMPEYDPMYTYCYTTSNRTIHGDLQSVDAWLRAVIKHMAQRRKGHGGAITDAEVVSIPSNLSDNAIENWLAFVSESLRAKAKRKQLKKPA